MRNIENPGRKPEQHLSRPLFSIIVASIWIHLIYRRSACTITTYKIIFQALSRHVYGLPKIRASAVYLKTITPIRPLYHFLTFIHYPGCICEYTCLSSYIANISSRNLWWSWAFRSKLRQLARKIDMLLPRSCVCVWRDRPKAHFRPLSLEGLLFVFSQFFSK